MVDDRTAWAAAADGRVGITTDGGATWRFARVPGHEQRDFRDVEGFSATRALIVAAGSPGLILDTADAGAPGTSVSATTARRCSSTPSPVSISGVVWSSAIPSTGDSC